MEHWVKKKRKKKKEEEEPAENQFHRLPDDVVVNIFDKVSDVQSLCRCLVVSKRFSSLIPLVQTLSFKTNAWDYINFPRYESEDALVNGSLGEISKFFIIELLLKTLLYFLNPSLSPCLLLNASGLVFLDKLTRVRSLNLELVSDFNVHKDSAFKWGAQFTSNLKSVTFLYATSFSKLMKSKEEEIENEITHKELLRRVNLAINCLKEAVLRLGILSPVIAKNPNLQSITITDSNNKGVKLCLSGEKLVKCMNAFDLETAIMRVGYVPVLRLPMYGYVMKRVTIVHFNLYGDDDSDAKTAMFEAFAEEQGVFFEAVVQILENHKDIVKAMFQN
ncbi:F-box protein AUF2-like [Rhododendron vialii]|uniref:F-box protein AUF2-like n=1 Tax=Rhododendron vialii TaxID=182163 RepID=UPI00265FE4D2|nr:F-box protein AUF2-like [Rhododendron vialii]